MQVPQEHGPGEPSILRDTKYTGGESDRRDLDTANELVATLYPELRKLAQARLSRLPPGQTLQPTALVHEVYMRLVAGQERGWNGRGHFFGAAARAMRDILANFARNKNAVKRGGGQIQIRETVTLIDGDRALALTPEELLSLHEALEHLEKAHPRKAEIVLLRYFAGLSTIEIAEVLEVSARTIEREWRFARAWLHEKLSSAH